MAKTDQDLAVLLKEGSKDAFSLLYDRYATRIHKFALSYLKSEHDAEELVQDVFFKLWQKKDKINVSQNIRSFIFKIAVNTIYDFVRRKNIEMAFAEFAAGQTLQSDSTWSEIVYNDMLSQINKLIDQMPEERKKIFRMSKDQCLSNDEIAIQTGLSKRTVENQLYRATSFLKENIKLDSSLSMLFVYLFY